jgi:ribosomal protein S30
MKLPPKARHLGKGVVRNLENYEVRMVLRVDANVARGSCKIFPTTGV